MPSRYVETREIPLDHLDRWPGNPRRSDLDAIRESIRRNGQYKSLTVRVTRDALVILAGNHTYDALRAEGAAAARCELITCDSDDEARRIVIADNRIADLGSYDEDLLTEQLSYLFGDYEGTGYTESEVLAMVHSADWVPEPPPDGSGVPLDVVVCPACSHRFPVL